MHKYVPRVHIIKKRDHTASVINLNSEEMKTFTFAQTAFLAVTAYQNQLVSSERCSLKSCLSCKNTDIRAWYSRCLYHRGLKERFCVKRGTQYHTTQYETTLAFTKTRCTDRLHGPLRSLASVVIIVAKCRRVNLACESEKWEFWWQ